MLIIVLFINAIFFSLKFYPFFFFLFPKKEEYKSFLFYSSSFPHRNKGQLLKQSTKLPSKTFLLIKSCRNTILAEIYRWQNMIVLEDGIHWCNIRLPIPILLLSPLIKYVFSTWLLLIFMFQIGNDLFFCHIKRVKFCPWINIKHKDIEGKIGKRGWETIKTDRTFK